MGYRRRVGFRDCGHLAEPSETKQPINGAAMTTVLLSAPYMLSCLERFQPVFKHYKLDLIVPPVNERLSEDEILNYAGQFDAAICGDDRYSKAVLEACLPLKSDL